MKRKKIYKWLLVCALVVCCVLTIGQGQIQGNATDVEKEGGIQIFVLQGTHNAVKLGANTMVQVEIVNEMEEDFIGTLQIQYISDEHSEEIVYEEGLSIKKQERIQVQKEVWVNQNFKKLWVGVADKDGYVVQKCTLKVSVVAPNQLMAGTLSGEETVPSCFKSKDFMQYEYTAESFPEEAKLFSGLDICYVQPKEMESLSEAQRNALQEWIKNGGTLVERLNPETMDVTKEGWVAIEGNEPDFTAYVKENEKGSQIVFSEKVYEWEEKQESKEFCKRVFREHGGEGVAKTQVASETPVYHWGLSPQCDRKFYQSFDLSVYIVILIVYVLVVSFGVYFFLRRKDKGVYAWAVIPAMAIVCSLIIYICGSSSRTTENYINYVSYVEFDKQGDTGKKVTNLEVTFLKDEECVIPLSSESVVGMTYKEDEIDSGALRQGKIRVINRENVPILKLEGEGGFSTKNVWIEENVEKKGMIEGRVSFENNQYTGEFVNNTQTKLKDAFFLVDGKMFWLGDLEKGSKISLENQEVSRYFVDVDMMQEVQHYFGFEYEMIPEGEYGEEALSKRLNEKDKYLQALKVYLANANFYYKVQKGVVIGIPEHTGENTDKIAGISSGGIDLWIYDVEVDYTNTKGETYIPNVFTRCGASQVGVDLCRNRMVSASNNGNVLIYSLDKNTTLSGLYYAKGNECLENYTNYRDGFGGILKIWNVKKENYEVLALRLGEALVEHPQDYVNEKGQIKFMVDEVEEWDYLPIISAIVKEVQ